MSECVGEQSFRERRRRESRGGGGGGREGERVVEM